MKEFCILPCHNCKKTPTIDKDLEREYDSHYIIRHCGMEVHANTETQVIVDWNKLNISEDDEQESTNEERTNF